MFFFFTTTTTTEIYTFSLHDALPILALLHGSEHLLRSRRGGDSGERRVQRALHRVHLRAAADRKSTRLNSSHRCNSYAVFCLKKKKKKLVAVTVKRDQITGQAHNNEF